MQLYQPTITGSLSVSGSINLSGSITIAGGGTISGTASIATNAITASSADNFLVRNTLTAQTLVVQTITSSVDFVTGSTRFGSISANTHQFTGSVGISGSLSGSSATFSSTINAAFANGNIKLSGGVVDGFLGVGVSNSKLYLTDYATALKGLILDLTTGAASFSNSITAASFIQTSGNATYFRAGNYTWMGGSGGDYGSVGYNIGYTATTTTYNYAVSDFASMLRFDSGGFNFLTATNGTAGNPITFTQRFNIANGGTAKFTTTNLTLESPSFSEVRSFCTTTGDYANFIVDTNNNTNYRLQIVGFGTTASGDLLGIGRAGNGFLAKGGGFLAIGTRDSNALVFSTNEIERGRFSNNGLFYVGTTSGVGFTIGSRIKGASTTENAEIISIDGGVEYSGFFKAVSGANYNGNACGMVIGRNTSSLRSINAGGTINATGTDYAEYMFKAIEDNIAKGDIVGINIEGKLTNIFDDSISFVVKSTDPSYVGGDTWGNSDSIGKEPRIEEGQTDEEYEQLKAEYQVKLEGVRAKVDRIAFSGQVPCNVTGSNVGDYIIPIELENGKIGGQAVSNPTFEQYQISVGKVWKIMEDGRAWIAVKIG